MTKLKKTYFGYKNEIDFAIETLPDEKLKSTIKECNKYGVYVKGFYTTFNISELAAIKLKITKDNEKRIFNILKHLECNRCLRVTFSYKEDQDLKLITIYANIMNKSKVFDIVRNSVKSKCSFDDLTAETREIYEMHQLLSKEDISHDIGTKNIAMVNTVEVKNIVSYFSYGSDRIKDVYNSLMNGWSCFKNEDSFVVSGINKNQLVDTLHTINDKLYKEFKWQEDELESFSQKYRWNPNDNDSNMFVRLSKVRNNSDL